jgi:hypothetical protein
VSPRRLAVGVLIAGVTFALVGAIAAARIKTRSESTTIAADQIGSTTPRCPRGSEAVAGGFASPGFDPQFGDASIFPSVSKRGRHRAWKTSGFNFGGATGKQVGYVYCDTHGPGLKAESDSTSVPPRSIDSATARCPGGSEAVSGGFWGYGPLDAYVIPFTSKRVGDNRWKVAGFNNDPNNPEQLTAFAYCDKDEPGLNAQSARVTVPSDATRSATANCGRGKSAYSGGYAGQVNPDSGGSSLDPDGPFTFKSKRTKGRDWTAAAKGVGEGSGGRLTVFAYCKG